MKRITYTFANGVQLYQSDMTEGQRQRYINPQNVNLHEPIEEHWLLRLMRSVDSGTPKFLDIGAAVGYYSILVKRIRPNATVVAVEPLPYHVKRMLAGLALNGISDAGVEIIEAAVDGRCGPGMLYRKRFGSHLVADRSGCFGIMAVSLVTLDHILSRHGCFHVVKMDIQGNELPVLRASRRALASGKIGSLVVGTHTKECHGILVNLLKNVGHNILYHGFNLPSQPDGLIVTRYVKAKAWHRLSRVARPRRSGIEHAVYRFKGTGRK